MINWPNEYKLKIIKEFQPLPHPFFKGDEDSQYASIWSLYFRICDSIKSFYILFQNKCYCDASIIAGHMLETCAILSYIKDGKSDADIRNNYNKYLASASLGRLKATLALEDDLVQPISWENFVCLLKIFYPVGHLIVRAKDHPKEKHEELIRKINYRKGPNKEKIGLLKRYEPVTSSEYINHFIKNLPFDDKGDINYFYDKYCSFKHSNVLTPGLSFEDSTEVQDFENMINLVLRIIVYLQKSDLNHWLP